MDASNLELARRANRTHLASLWRQREGERDTLSQEDRTLLMVMERHRELHPLWERLDDLPNDIVVGEMNPLVHVVMDSVVERQCIESEPPVVQETVESLVKAGFSRQRAVHVVGHVLAWELLPLLLGDEPFHEDRYVGRLALVREGAKDPSAYDKLFRRIGRNDSCPCGSGKKFKKCCRDVLPVPVDPHDWAFVLTEDAPFCTPEYVAEALDDDLAVLLQNTSAVAQAFERMRAWDSALEVYRDLINLARTAGQSEGRDYLLENALYQLMEFVESHLEFAEAGLAAVDELSQRSDLPDDEKMSLASTREDFLTVLGGPVE